MLQNRCTNFKNTIKLQGIRSRMKSNKTYKIWIDFDYETINENNLLLNSISCCSCKSGLRTIGSCAHIIAALYYIGINFGTIKMPNILPRSSTHLDNIKDISLFVSQEKKE